MSLRLLARLLPVLALSTATGCFDDKDDDDEDEDEDDDSGSDWGTTTWTGTGTGTGPGDADTPSVSVNWGSGSVDVAVNGGPGAYWFGMAETADCVDCWTGEDCIYGYTLGDGSSLAWCHDGGDNGTSLTYGGDATALAAGTTVWRESAEGSVTYYLESDAEFGGDGSCYVWGNDTSYYDGLGCREL